MKTNEIDIPDGIKSFRYQNMFMKIIETNPDNPDIFSKICIIETKCKPVYGDNTTKYQSM